MTPPLIFLIFVPGLFTSKERKTCITASFFSFLSGVLIVDSIEPINASMFNPDCAEIGITGDFAAKVPLTNFVIS